MQEKQTIALALGSGGARGLAHIGVLRRLEEAGYEIGYIAGTSIGALVGGVYAADKLDDYERWARELTRRDMLRLLDFSFTRGSIFKGDRVIDAICDLIGDPDIEQLQIGYTAVATDLREQSEVWITSGSLFNAIRASTAIPALMSPLSLGDQLLADGGLVNPIPIAPTMNLSGAMTVAVDLNGPREGLSDIETASEEPESEQSSTTKSPYRKAISEFVDRMTPSRDTSEKDSKSYPGFASTVTQTIEIMQNGIARLKMAAYKPDLVVQIPRDVCQFWEFDKAADIIEFGYERATRALEQYGARKSPN
ncbi:MAG: patatin-like phospholipase family protein [Pseudomonadota bacterium]